jgi:hypothetical protein
MAHHLWRHSQVVRQRSAKPLFPSSNLGGASIRFFLNVIFDFVPLAQSDRAFDYESKGREFESLRARHICDCSSEGEHHLDTVGATGSIPVSRTRTFLRTDCVTSICAFFVYQQRKCSSPSKTNPSSRKSSVIPSSSCRNASFTTNRNVP